ncbi:unnamed protein product [Microthlaspi erraticum]|nr:unnamed protein product [Microthlaspi erraticum]
MHAFVEQGNQMNRVPFDGSKKEDCSNVQHRSHTCSGSDVFIPLDILPYEYVLGDSSNVENSFTRDFLGFIFEVNITKLTEDDSIPRNALNDDPKITNSIDFTLQDNDGARIICRAKGALGAKFLRFWLYYGKTESIVCLLTDWRILDIDDPVHVQSEEGISTFEFNPIGLDEVDYFTEIMCSSDPDSEEEEDEEMEFDYFNGCKSENKK